MIGCWYYLFLEHFSSLKHTCWHFLCWEIDYILDPNSSSLPLLVSVPFDMKLNICLPLKPAMWIIPQMRHWERWRPQWYESARVVGLAIRWHCHTDNMFRLKGKRKCGTELSTFATAQATLNEAVANSFPCMWAGSVNASRTMKPIHKSVS